MQEHINRLTGAAILSVLVCSTLAWLFLGIPSSGINDADVYLVHAHNFMAGHGIVYNMSGGASEGFPSLLWMMVCSFFYIFTLAPEVPLLLINLLFGMLTVYICLKRSSHRITFMVLLCAAPAWFAWGQVAMVEAGLWCLLLTAAMLAVSELNISKLTWLLPLLMLCRPESILWGGWMLFVLLLELGLDQGWRDGLRKGFRPVFAFGISGALLMLFRGLYFGHVVPAQGVQIDLGAGFLYLLGWLFSNPVILPVFLIFCWVCVREIRRKRGLSPVLRVCICLLPGLVIPLFTGDTAFRGFRYYQPVWPLLCLIAAWALPLLYDPQHLLLRRITPVILILAGWIIFALSPNLKQEFRMARQSREQGAVLARMFDGYESLPSVGAMTAGGCKHTYSGDVYNLKVLTTPKMDLIPVEARGTENPLPFKLKVFLNWSPDILIRNTADATDLLIFSQLQSETLFQQRYLKGELWYNDEILFGYFSREFLNRLEEGHYAFSQDLQYALSMEDPLDLSVEPDESTNEAPVSGFAVQDQDNTNRESRPL